MNCHICNKKSEGFVVKRKKWEKIYYKCPRCEYIFIDPKELLNTKEELGRYEEHNNSIEDSGYRNYFKDFIEYSMEGVDKDASILDYGSGPQPVLASVMEELGYTNVSIYDKYFTKEELDPNKKYDLITSTEVVEHIYEPMDTFRDLANRLVSGGRLVIMTNFHLNDMEHFRKWWYTNDPTHVVFYNVKTMEYIADFLGLEVVKTNNKNIIIFKKEKE